MKLTKKSTTVYTASVPSFKGFYELKCNLVDDIAGGDFEPLREELCPECTSDNTVLIENSGIEIRLLFYIELGWYPVEIDLHIISNLVEVKFGSVVHDDNSFRETQISEKFIKILVKEFLPVVESFLDKLEGIERNHPCEKDCYHNKLRKEKGLCNDTYISISDHTANKAK